MYNINQIYAQKRIKNLIDTQLKKLILIKSFNNIDFLNMLKNSLKLNSHYHLTVKDRKKPKIYKMLL